MTVSMEVIVAPLPGRGSTMSRCTTKCYAPHSGVNKTRASTGPPIAHERHHDDENHHGDDGQHDRETDKNERVHGVISCFCRRSAPTRSPGDRRRREKKNAWAADYHQPIIGARTAAGASARVEGVTILRWILRTVI